MPDALLLTVLVAGLFGLIYLCARLGIAYADSDYALIRQYLKRVQQAVDDIPNYPHRVYTADAYMSIIAAAQKAGTFTKETPVLTYGAISVKLSESPAYRAMMAKKVAARDDIEAKVAALI